MTADYNPLTDFQLAHEADEHEISNTFRQLPWCKRLVLMNNKIVTRMEWQHQQFVKAATRNGKH